MSRQQKVWNSIWPWLTVLALFFLASSVSYALFGESGLS